MSPGVDDRERVLRALWRKKMHVEADALERSSPRFQAAFETIWGPADRLRDGLVELSVGLLGFWLDAPGGHVVFTHRESAYVPGTQEWRGQTLEGVCYLSVADVVPTIEPALPAFVAMLDHLLGSLGRGDGGCFSGGEGASESLAMAAERFVRAYALGYGAAELGSADAVAYLTDALALYLRDRAALNAIDPLVERLLAQTLMNEAFWSFRPGRY